MSDTIKANQKVSKTLETSSNILWFCTKIKTETGANNDQAVWASTFSIRLIITLSFYLKMLTINQWSDYKEVHYVSIWTGFHRKH